MKQVKNLVLVALFTLGLGSVANAQKTGHINTDKLLSEMPATKALKTEMEKLQKTYKDEISAFAKQLQDTYKKYEAEAATQTEETNTKRAQEMQQGQSQLAQAEQAATQDMQRKYQEKLGPIVEKAMKAIQDVAAAKSIIYVFDSSLGKGLIVFEKGEDLFDAVKTKLGF